LEVSISLKFSYVLQSQKGGSFTRHPLLILLLALVEEIVFIVCGEVVFGAGLTVQRLAVGDFSQVVQPAGDAIVAVRIEGVVCPLSSTKVQITTASKGSISSSMTILAGKSNSIS